MRISRLVAAASLAAACAFGTAACSVEVAPDGADPPSAEPTNIARPITTELDARAAMAELWTDHVTWMRVYIISSIADLPDTSYAAERLFQNQHDIGDALRPFYGGARSAKLTRLLRAHVSGASYVIAAAKERNERQLEKAKAAWYANAWRIGALLAEGSSKLSERDFVSMMNTHLDQTFEEVNARLEENWIGDIEAHDAVIRNALQMADALSDEIAQQFPDEVVMHSKLGPTHEALHLSMRNLWTDHVAWTRFFVISAIADLPDSGMAQLRLLRNQMEIGEAMRPFYGDAASDRLTQLLMEHVLLASDVVLSAESGEGKGAANVQREWYANAGAIATLLARTNPFWSRPELESMMHALLDQTMMEVNARLHGHYSRDVQVYDAVVQHALEMADTLSDGIADQFPRQLAK